MTVAAEPRQSVLALELIKPFTEAADARLRGNAVIALVTLIEGPEQDMRGPATDELIGALCTEPAGGGGPDWERRFAAVSVEALSRLKPSQSLAIGQKLFERFSESREPTQRAAIARLILAGCDHGGQLWPIGRMQFMRFTGLAGRPGLWPCIWAAMWRSGLAWFALYFTSDLLAQLEHSDFYDSDIESASFILGLGSTFFLGLIARFSVPGHLRPPAHIYIWDIVINAAVFGLFVVLLTLYLLPEKHTFMAVLAELGLTAPKVLGSLSSIFLVGALIAALVRALRWVTAFAIIEPEGSARLLRPIAAMALATGVCIAAAHLGMDAGTAAAIFVVAMPSAAIMASLDIWLEEKGTRSLRSFTPRFERRWLLPATAGIAALAALMLLWSNVRTAPAATPLSETPGPVNLSSTREVTAPTRLGDWLLVSVDEAGTFDIFGGAGDITASVLVRDAAGKRVIPAGYDWPLDKGDYKVCATMGTESCLGLKPQSLIEHVIWSFGFFDPALPATLKFTPKPPTQ